MCSRRARTTPSGSGCGTGSRKHRGVNSAMTPPGAWGSSQCEGAHMGCCVGRANDLKQ